MSLVELIFLGGVAVFIILRYRAMLGRRDGHEQQPPVPRRGGGQSAPQQDADTDSSNDDNVIELPGKRAPSDPSINIDRVAKPGSDVHAGLTQISLADHTFDAKAFEGGAKAAYEMIVTAFAEGDREALKPLLSDEVYEGFDGVITARQAANHTADTQVIGINEAKIIEAGLQGRDAEETLRFRAEVISTVRNEDGAILEGHPNTVSEIIDTWTFERNVDSDNPNWRLVSTSG